MTRHFVLSSAVTAGLALSACQEAAEDNAASEAGPAATENAASDDRQGEPNSDPVPQTDAAATIPAAMRGRWGLVPADCTSTRGDAKGLIEVGDSDIRFYESVGRVETVAAKTDSAFRASFAFTGEGMEWTRDMRLSLGKDGTTLTRSEFGEDALAEPLSYSKCS